LIYLGYRCCQSSCDSCPRTRCSNCCDSKGNNCDSCNCKTYYVDCNCGCKSSVSNSRCSVQCGICSSVLTSYTYWLDNVTELTSTIDYHCPKDSPTCLESWITSHPINVSTIAWFDWHSPNLGVQFNRPEHKNNIAAIVFTFIFGILMCIAILIIIGTLLNDCFSKTCCFEYIDKLQQCCFNCLDGLKEKRISAPPPPYRSPPPPFYESILPPPFEGTVSTLRESV